MVVHELYEIEQTHWDISMAVTTIDLRKHTEHCLNESFNTKLKFIA